MQLIQGQTIVQEIPITESGVYNIPAERYHSDRLMKGPTLSSGAVWSLIEESPLHCWQQHPRFGGAEIEREKKRFMEMGSAIHSMVLGSGEPITQIDADNYRTKAAQELRDAAIGAWKIPLLAGDYVEAVNTTGAIREALARHEDASLAFTGGKPEQTLIWFESTPDGKGIWCRARLDYLADRSTFDDLKTTPGSANPARWSKRNLFNNGCDIQAAFYIRGIKALGLAKRPIFRFIVAETKLPYGLAAIACSETLITYADQKVQMALDLWRKCLATNNWPGYSNSTVWADVPSYLFSEQEERRLQMEEEEFGG